jgi:hypothetical protein
VLFARIEGFYKGNETLIEDAEVGSMKNQ